MLPRVHSPASLKGTQFYPLNLLRYPFSQSHGIRAESRRYTLRDLGAYVSNLLVSDGLVVYFRNFHTLQFLVFPPNGAKTKKHSVCDGSMGGSAFLIREPDEFKSALYNSGKQKSISECMALRWMGFNCSTPHVVPLLLSRSWT